tara:strand:+ start:495 stop:1784 length:1290 start_codon:yes stop_codon:yes gene_type:complete
MANRFLDEITSKSINFNLGFVDSIFVNNTDNIKQSEEGSSTQMVVIKSLSDDSSMPTTSRTLPPSRPLLRGISDSITRGDIVLWTEIRKKYYYIGPLNTFNNPNFSNAPFYKNTLEGRDSATSNLTNSQGYGQDFPYLKNVKLEKTKNDVLDFYSDDAIYEISKVSDLLFEGRHGNSIRIGSRGIFPNLIIDNGSVGPTEDVRFGSTLAMLSNGSISQNFNLPDTFRLSMDTIKENGESVTPFRLNVGNDNDEVSFNYDYGKEDADVTTKNDLNQIIMFSDRITFDARNSLGGDFTVSANNNINFGAKKNFTLNNEGYSVINSNNIYLGEKAKNKAEPIVLGEQLRILLEQVLNILSNAHALVQGVPLPLVDATGAPLNVASGPLVNSVQSLTEIIQSLEERQQDDNGVYQDGVTPFLSKHHFIETNRS